MTGKFKSIALGLAVGAGLAIMLGAAVGGMAVWLSAGIAVGVLFMAAAQKASKSV
jgi:F0F1-type ATP synthase assembly protein I